MAAARGVLVGGTADVANYGDQDFYDLYSRESAIMQAEGSMKQFTIEGQEGVFTFDKADQMVALAAANGVPYRLHTLIQAGAMAPWFLNGLTPVNWQGMFADYIAAVLAHLTGPRSIDVVGECLSSNGSGYADNAFFQAAGGIGYVAKAFELARGHNGSAILCLSENQIEYYASKRTALYGLLDTLVPTGNIDAVAVQSHLRLSRSYDFDAIQTMFETIKGYGIKANITELDVSAQAAHSTDEQDRLAARLVQNYVEAWRAAECGDELLAWGLSDRHSWLHDEFPAYTQRPLPFDANLQPKLMVDAIKTALRT